MARAVLHVGTHKTATTTLQDTFFANRARLARHGVIYPVLGATRGHHGLASRWIRMPAPYGLDDPAAAWAGLARAHAGSDATVFLSSEEFSRARPARVDMAELRDALSGFEEVAVICTLRNQAGYIQSVYQQISKDRAPPPFERFLAQAMESRLADGLWLNYGALHAHLLTGFAPEEITYLSYEAAVAAPGGILGRFLELLGVPMAPGDLEPYGIGASNVSPEPLAQLAANVVAAPGRADPGLVALAGAALARILAPGQRSTLYTRAEARQVARRFAPANRAFEAELRARQPEFALAPLDLAGERLWRGELTPAFWASLARALHRARRAADCV